MRRQFARPWLTCVFALGAATACAQDHGRITNLYDAFGAPSGALVKDWGYAALVEYGGKRILFDTGNHGDIFKNNTRALEADLARLDAVIISHRHGDHTSGLNHLLEVHPTVAIYTPREGAYFKGRMPADFIEHHPGLPRSLQYFDGGEPTRFETGTPWEKADFRMVSDSEEIFPGFHVVSVQSQKPGTMEMNELSLAIRTPQGMAVVVGCSHPGIEKILERITRIEPRIYTVTGGFHLVRVDEPEVNRVAMSLRDKFGVRRVAPAHCTSERGFAAFRRVFGRSFDEAGLGARIPLP